MIILFSNLYTPTLKHDFLIGGGAAACAAIFSNPFDVVKTRMQLQGELKSSAEFKELYRNVPHAFYLIAKTDGITALQKGLIPALGFHMIFNSIRLGLYQTAENNLLTKNDEGKPDVVKSIFFGALSGIVGAFVASPLYLIKTRIQSSGNEKIAVGFQYHYRGTMHAFEEIYSKGGIKGLWRGWQTAVPRLGFGSSIQLATFSREIMTVHDVLLDDKFTATLIASNISATVLAVFMCPFDVIATRVCNQEVGDDGKGKMYNGIRDCAIKIVKAEGFFALYKGVIPYFLRAVPHNILSLVFFDTFMELLHESL